MRPAQAFCFLALSVACCGLAATTAQETGNQPEIPTLKVTTQLVAISAVVKSKDGEAKQGLTKDDFVLKQDGKEEPIAFFSRGSDLPLSIALMVDTSASQLTFVDDEELASDVFFETMLGRQEDRAALVEFDTKIVSLRSMTNSANALHLALSRLNTRPQNEMGTLLNDAVYSTARTMLAGETGRKAMIILSDGGDVGSHHSINEAIEQAQRADVQIYSILYSAFNSMGNTPNAIDTGLGALQRLSEATGGRVFKVSRSTSLRQIYGEIADDLRLQYELGYKPPTGAPANSYHKLELRAKDKKLSVQARKGFYQPA